MKGTSRRAAVEARPPARESCGLVAAYREGLGLAAISVVATAGELRVTAVAAAGAEAEVVALWWCRSAPDAARVAAAAARRLGRGRCAEPGEGKGLALALACASVEDVARRINVALRTDLEINEEASTAVARLDAEIENLRQSGGLKSVNKAYRAYRLESSARGEKILRYDDWMRKYKENLLRQVAATLRAI